MRRVRPRLRRRWRSPGRAMAPGRAGPSAPAAIPSTAPVRRAWAAQAARRPAPPNGATISVPGWLDADNGAADGDRFLHRVHGQGRGGQVVRARDARFTVRPRLTGGLRLRPRRGGRRPRTLRRTWQQSPGSAGQTLATSSAGTAAPFPWRPVRPFVRRGAVLPHGAVTGQTYQCAARGAGRGQVDAHQRRAVVGFHDGQTVPIGSISGARQAQGAARAVGHSATNSPICPGS